MVVIKDLNAIHSQFKYSLISLPLCYTSYKNNKKNITNNSQERGDQSEGKPQTFKLPASLSRSYLSLSSQA